MTIARRLLDQRMREVAYLMRGPVLDVGGESEHSISNFERPDVLWYVTNIDRRYRPDVMSKGEALPFADGTFKSVLVMELLEHVEQPRRILEEAHRVLGPEGRLFLSMPFLYRHHPNPCDYQRWSHEKIYGELEHHCGFDIEICVPRGAWIATVMDILTQGLGAFVPGTFWGSKILNLIGRTACWGIETTFPIWMKADQFLAREDWTKSFFHRFTIGYLAVAKKIDGRTKNPRAAGPCPDILRFPKEKAEQHAC